MKMIGVGRLGQDAQLRFTPNGKAVVGMSLAFNYGQKGADGKRPTQWIDAALFGKQAEALSQYMIKGTAWLVTLDDVHIEEYQRKDGGSSSKLTAKVASVDFIPGLDYGHGETSAQQPRQQQAAPQQRQQAPQQQAPIDDDFNDSIPF